MSLWFNKNFRNAALCSMALVSMTAHAAALSGTSSTAKVVQGAPLAATIAVVELGSRDSGGANGNVLAAQILGANARADQVPLPSSLPLFASTLLLAGAARLRRNK